MTAMHIMVTTTAIRLPPMAIQFPTTATDTDYGYQRCWPDYFHCRWGG
jgi:hypothetical protein